MDVFDDGASQVERPIFVGYIGVQNGLFWCVRMEELRNAAYTYILHGAESFLSS